MGPGSPDEPGDRRATEESTDGGGVSPALGGLVGVRSEGKKDQRIIIELNLLAINKAVEIKYGIGVGVDDGQNQGEAAVDIESEIGYQAME